MSYSPSLIAYAFVKKGDEENMPVTQMKLQKLVYIAHGLYLAKYGEPLVSEEFEAWHFGPVLPKIYEDYRSFGSEPIKKNVNRLDLSVDALPDAVKNILAYTWNATAKLSAYTLSNWTHIPGSPWHKAYIPNVMGITIDNSIIETYFKSKFFQIKPDSTGDETGININE